ncbi:MAG TPA: HAD-IC family P-type ATPase [Xanthomonadaceae bacterium]|nr:HAD-IC family P-type ATPase [Xanthomonadaceae bacterium]
MNKRDVAAQEPDRTPDWHAVDAAAVLESLDANRRGLSTEKAQSRLAVHGPNALPTGPPRAAWKRLLMQFHNVLIYILLVAGIAASFMDHWVDAAVILAVVVANALIGFIQEGKAERAMDAIGQMLALRAHARRDGCWRAIPAEHLVPGDIVRLRAGDKVPADIRLLESHSLRIEQAALTGESMPVSKHVDALGADTALADRACMAYSGTMVAAGQGVGVTVATGSATELGRISTLLGEVRRLTTPLLREIARFGHLLTVVILLMAALMVAFGRWLHGIALSEGFMAGVALAVAAIPEGLPAIISITLAIGVQRMSARKAIVRQLPAVETLGAVSVICTDKTGTLTRNELVAECIGVAGGLIGAGEATVDNDELRLLLEAATLCNDVDVGAEGGDPLERALVELALAAGLDVDALRQDSPRRALLPFSSEHKYMVTLHSGRLCMKGAPERVIDRCSMQYESRGVRPLQAERWRRQLESMARDGLRVLAIAERRLGEGKHRLEDTDVESDLCLLGLVGFADPPRPEVPAAVAACRDAGITVKMITGDHGATATAIARHLGIAGGGGVLTGPEIDLLSAQGLADQVDDVHVYARTTPEHKLRLVTALQARGNVVAMTGDGANDAPALKRADIGVAMGIKGTEASRQAAEMVLADDNFATIVSGIEEGRGVYDNIRKAILFILPTNAAEAMVILLAVLAGVALPITPVQILWINMATAVTLALSLAFEPLEGNVMQRRPRPMGRGLITPFVAWRIAWVGGLLTAATFALYMIEILDSGDELTGRTVAVNMLVFGEIVYLFNSRRWVAPGWTREALFANPWAWISVAVLLVLQMMLTYAPPMQRVFGTTGLGVAEWLWIIGLAGVLFVVVEAEKALHRAAKRRRRKAIGSARS